MWWPYKENEVEMKTPNQKSPVSQEGPHIQLCEQLGSFLPYALTADNNFHGPSNQCLTELTLLATNKQGHEDEVFTEWHTLRSA